MKKLERLDLNQCEVLSHNKLSSIFGGQKDTSTHESICVESTSCCADDDLAYKITWDCGGTATNMICL